MFQRAEYHLKRVLEILDGAGSVEEARRYLADAVREMDRQPVEDPSSGGRMRGRSFFDRLIERMLDQVKRAESREALIDDTLSALAEDAGARAGVCYLVLEGYIRPDGTIVDLDVLACQAVQPQRLQNFQRDAFPKLAESPVVRDVMIKRETVDFYPMNFEREVFYFGEFDRLVDLRNKRGWLCALPLPAAETRHPSRMLVVIYPMVGQADAPALPRNAMQEWRTFTFLRVPYEMLNHQLASTGEFVAQQRRAILAELGPGLINHEINQQLKVLGESANLMNWAIRKLEIHVPKDNLAFDAVVSGLVNVLDAIERLRRITDAFNNLERRPSDVPVSVDELVEEIDTLLHYKLARSGAKLTTGGDLDVKIVTDASLLEHVMINILTNALEAIDASGKTPSGVPWLNVDCHTVEDTIEIRIANNGPPITLSRPEQIFEKGFTTKPRGVGHGFGLYLCRMIMTYLDGNIAMIDPDSLVEGFNAGFKLVLPVSRKGSDDIAPSTLNEWRHETTFTDIATK